MTLPELLLVTATTTDMPIHTLVSPVIPHFCLLTLAMNPINTSKLEPGECSFDVLYTVFPFGPYFSSSKTSEQNSELKQRQLDDMPWALHSNHTLHHESLVVEMTLKPRYHGITV